MFILNIIFILFFLVIIVSGIFIMSSRNPIQSILYLVTVFCSSACLLVMLKIEFLAMLLLLVYVGAIAVLFLFIVMMLNVRIIELREGFFSYIPVGGIVVILFFSEIVLLAYVNLNSSYSFNFEAILELWIFSCNSLGSVILIGQLIYSFYGYLLIVTSFVLLLSLIGSITLTLEQGRDIELYKRQEIFNQINRPSTNIYFWFRT